MNRVIRCSKGVLKINQSAYPHLYSRKRLTSSEVRQLAKCANTLTKPDNYLTTMSNFRILGGYKIKNPHSKKAMSKKMKFICGLITLICGALGLAAAGYCFWKDLNAAGLVTLSGAIIALAGGVYMLADFAPVEQASNDGSAENTKKATFMTRIARIFQFGFGNKATISQKDSKQ